MEQARIVGSFSGKTHYRMERPLVRNSPTLAAYRSWPTMNATEGQAEIRRTMLRVIERNGEKLRGYPPCSIFTSGTGSRYCSPIHSNGSKE